MEDEVPFKVFTYWSEDSKPEVRRFGVEKTDVSNFHYIIAKILDIYPGLKGKSYTLSWDDEDGDDVTISSDEELMVALTAPFGKLVKLNVHVKGDSKDDQGDVAENPTVGPCSSTHYGVMCDGCDTQIVGFRYKCTSCDDFDLCSKCEGAGLHPEHCMVRVPSPIMPRTLIKAAIKRSRHFLKTVAGVVGDENIHKRHKNDKSGERRHRGDHHGGDRRGESRDYRGEHPRGDPPRGDHPRGDHPRGDHPRGDHPRGDHPRGDHPRGDHPRGDHNRSDYRRRTSTWLDTFATYMNEFANLAGDVPFDTGANAPEPNAKPEQKTQEQHSSATKQHASAATQVQPEFKEASTSKAIPRRVAIAVPSSTTLAQFPKILDMFFAGKLDNLMQDAEEAAATPNATSAPNAAPALNAAPTSNAPNDGDVEMAQAGPNPFDNANVSVKSETSSTDSDGSSRDTTPEKVDDWTVINKEKDLMDAFGKPSAPAETPNIGFNLPDEFQLRMKVTEVTHLYPPLNMNTAEPEPQMPQQVPLKPQPAQPAQTAHASAPTQEKPQSTRPLHPKAHIDAAIQQMLCMGFTNDGGWLTQLLESKDGNIAAVLDLLTPVNPK